MKKFLEFFKYFFVYSFGSVAPFFMFGWFIKFTVDAVNTLAVVVFEPHLLDDLLNGYTPYFFAASSGCFFIVGILGIFVSLFFIFRGVRYASFKYRAAKLAAAPTNPEA